MSVGGVHRGLAMGRLAHRWSRPGLRLQRLWDKGAHCSGQARRNSRPSSVIEKPSMLDKVSVQEAKPGSPVSAPSVLEPVKQLDSTYVPRKQGVTDGVWDKQDEAAVKEALEDAESVVAKGSVESGQVLLGMSVPELEALAAKWGEQKYRGKQLQHAVLLGARSVADITTISKPWRQKLQEAGIRTGRSIVYSERRARDGTRKFLLQLSDGRVVETVGIPEDDARRPRLTVCVSSQVGCPMRCTFCATGNGGFARNLKPHEIIDQVLTVQEQFDQRVSNVVFMGMGEPLLNLKSVLEAYGFINEVLGVGARGITISTVGVPNAIARLSAHKLQASLAVSLHAPTQKLRETLVPSAKAYPLSALMHDCRHYFEVTGRRLSFEYTLIRGVNDQQEHAKQLVQLLKQHKSNGVHVNLIPWNPVTDSTFQRPKSQEVARFKNILQQQKVTVSVRATRGLEAAAACGQLRNEFQKTPLKDFQLPG